MRFNKNDVLDALGIEREGVSDWILPSLAGFGIGCVVGAVVTALIAPKTGRELREELVERGRDLYWRGKEMGREFAGTPEGGKPPTQAF